MFDFSPAAIMRYVLILPIILLALSVHEASHGYIASKLGDPTAKSLGRLTLNPLKHLDVFGFLCMLFFHFGWAKPVPVNARYFKKPRRGMALTSAAGPVSNVLLAIIFAILLRLELMIVNHFFYDELVASVTGGTASTAFNMLSVLCYMLYMGVLLNISLAVFNLIPIPPFDGSRIFYVFLPQKLYFYVMKYENIIMIVILLALWFVPFFSSLISTATGGLSQMVLWLFGIKNGSDSILTLNIMLNHLATALFA
jgi:Zn-dependent protease